MSTLDTLRADLASDLKNTLLAGNKWEDADLDRAILKATGALDLSWPNATTFEFAAAEGVRAYDLTAAGVGEVARLIAVERVECPADQDPREYVPFEVADTDAGLQLRLTLATGPEATDTVRLYVATCHLVDAAGSTIPVHLEPVVLTGAMGYAALAYAAYAINRVNVSSATVAQLTDFAETCLADFRRSLADLRQRRATVAPSYTTFANYEI
ncbi:MAG: hypothetical protein M0Z94_11440 [Dehalococcoidales bacterium]|nr:hypothetical protein [Dehalococcoidales bacterium]